MENDLISRKTAKEEIQSWAVRIHDPANLSTEDTMTVLDTLPAVDAVPVRCKDCQFSKFYEESGRRHCRAQNGMYRAVEDMDFCSYGERKVNE